MFTLLLMYVCTYVENVRLRPLTTLSLESLPVQFGDLTFQNNMKRLWKKYLTASIRILFGAVNFTSTWWKISFLRTRVARCFFTKHTKAKNCNAYILIPYPFTKSGFLIPKVHIYLSHNIFSTMASQAIANLVFWYANKPSGSSPNWA
jgi:hypothetical protein